MEKDKTFFTRLTYEHKCIEDYSARKIVVEEPVWDMTGNDMIEMLHTVMIGATFCEDSFVGSLISWMEEHHPEYIITKSEEYER